MKKKYASLQLCVLLLSMYAFRIVAQPLSGVYTIDNTISSSASNFTSFTAFASAINAGGVSGPVTVNVGVTSGPYNEQVTFTQAAGISATNSVTINGNGRVLSFNSSSNASPHTLMLTGADYMFFHNLEIRGLGATYALAVHLWNSANFNQFHNCLINTPLNGTSSLQVPFSVSGNQTSATSSGNSGNNNIVHTCTISGGYWGTVFYGNTSSPYNLDNQVINSHLVDWYVYGVYHAYTRNTVFSRNVFERVNRTTITTAYALMITSGSQGLLIERNHVRRLFDAVQPNANTAYCIYIAVGASPNNENIIRNNLISDVRCNGTLCGLYLPSASYVIAEHNTISLDDANSTGNTTYGIYLTAGNCTIRNNVISIERGGTSSSNRTAMYFGSAAALTNTKSHNNVFHVDGASGGNDYIGFVAGPGYYSTLQNWQVSTNLDWSSFDADPVFINPAIYNYAPSSIVINNGASPVGVPVDFTGANRSLGMPDPGAFEFFTTPCSQPSGAGTFAVPSVSICPGSTVQLALTANVYTNSGYAVQWQLSTVSQFGGYSSVSGATVSEHVTQPLNVLTWYQAVVTCTNSAVSVTTSPGAIMIASASSSAVPYFESFETLGWNQLPNCSWATTVPSTWPTTPTYTFNATGNRVPRTGNNFAAFTASLSGTQYFYTNDIWMVPGITYSVSLWYIVQTPGFNDWSELTILVGQGQSGGQTVATVAPVTGALYQPLGNTFMVPTAGFYNVAIRATAGSGVAPYISWDDLSITIPCTLNSPALGVSPSSSLVCAGQPVHIHAIGADTYTWSTGSNFSTIVEAPASNTTYVVVGGSTLTGCSTTVTQVINVNPSPQVMVFANNPVCLGDAVNLTAQGDQPGYTYMWAHGPSGASVSHIPSSSTTYSVTGTNSFGCYTMASANITVNPVPNVSASGPTLVCVGDAVTLTGSGALSYQWTAPNVIYVGSPVVIYPKNSDIYVMTGTDQNGCKGTDQLILAVDDCVGLREIAEAGFSLYPNPTTGVFEVRTTRAGEMNITVYDVAGRVLASKAGTGMVTGMDLGAFAAGIYYVDISIEGRSEVIKVIKH